MNSLYLTGTREGKNKTNNVLRFIARSREIDRRLIVRRHVIGSHPGLSRRHEDVVGVQHVLAQLAVLGIPGGTQKARKVLLPAALESQVLHHVVPHLIRSAALMAVEGPFEIVSGSA